MTQLNSKSIKIFLQEVLSKDGNFLKKIVKMLLPEIREEERDAQVGVLSQQRDHTKRKTNRNGYKPRSLHTRVGSLLLGKLQIREFAFQNQLCCSVSLIFYLMSSLVCTILKGEEKSGLLS